MSIVDIQRQLSYLGYYEYSIEDIDSNNIRDAIKRFQIDQGIVPTGLWNDVTNTAMTQIIICIQEFLNDVVKSNLIVNGIAGYATSVATSRYQRARGIYMSGIADRNTITKIAEDMRYGMDDEFI